MTNEQIILAGVVVYLVMMVMIGLWAARRSRTAQDFIVAGRSLPLWLCTATIIATWIGGSSMLGVSGQAYIGGLHAVVADPFGAALGIVLVGLFVIRIVRRMRLYTVYEIVEHRFGSAAALLWSIYGAAVNIGWIGATMVAFGFVFKTLVGLPLEIGIVMGGVIVVAYAFVGGMWAVAITDFVQLMIIVIGAVVLFALVVSDMGGVQAAWSAVPADKVHFLPVSNTAEDWLNFVRALFIIGIANLGGQALLQRGLAAKSESVAVNSYLLAGVGYLAVGLIPVALGILGSVLMPELADRQSVVPLLAEHYLHPVVMAVFVGALLAAIMSSADSALLATSSIVSVNILPRVWPSASTQLLQVTRYTIIVVGVLAMIVALMAQTIFELILMINAPGLAATVVPFVAALYWRKANRWGAWAAMLSGLGVWALAAAFAPDLPGDLLGMAASFVALVVVSVLSQRVDPPAAQEFVRAD